MDQTCTYHWFVTNCTTCTIWTFNYLNVDLTVLLECLANEMNGVHLSEHLQLNWHTNASSSVVVSIYFETIVSVYISSKPLPPVLQLLHVVPLTDSPQSLTHRYVSDVFWWSPFMSCDIPTSPMWLYEMLRISRERLSFSHSPIQLAPIVSANY